MVNRPIIWRDFGSIMNVGQFAKTLPRTSLSKIISPRLSRLDLHIPLAKKVSGPQYSFPSSVNIMPSSSCHLGIHVSRSDHCLCHTRHSRNCLTPLSLVPMPQRTFLIWMTSLLLGLPSDLTSKPFHPWISTNSLSRVRNGPV